MSLDLDDETREALGWGSHIEERGVPSFALAVPKPPRPPKPVKFDGRSRRNWRHRNMPAKSPKQARQCESDVEMEAGHG